VIIFLKNGEKKKTNEEKLVRFPEIQIYVGNIIITQIFSFSRGFRSFLKFFFKMFHVKHFWRRVSEHGMFHVKHCEMADASKKVSYNKRFL